MFHETSLGNVKGVANRQKSPIQKRGVKTWHGGNDVRNIQTVKSQSAVRFASTTFIEVPVQFDSGCCRSLHASRTLRVQ